MPTTASSTRTTRIRSSTDRPAESPAGAAGGGVATLSVAAGEGRALEGLGAVVTSGEEVAPGDVVALGAALGGCGVGVGDGSAAASTVNEYRSRASSPSSAEKVVQRTW